MGSDKRMAVALVLTPDPGLLPVVQGLVGGLADQMGFAESRRINLQQGVEQACRRLLGSGPGDTGGELRLDFAAFADRLEILVENGGENSETAESDFFLLTQLLDRVAFEQTPAGKRRLTLVQHLSGVRSQL